MKQQFHFLLLSWQAAVCRLPVEADIPAWACKGAFFSLTRTQEEISVVCQEELVPEGTQCEKNWRILKIQGVLDFSLVGILASISTLLAKAGISIFAISTYDTDYVLVQEKQVRQAVAALRAAGHCVEVKD